MTLNLVLLHPQECWDCRCWSAVPAVLGDIAETCSMESTYHFSALPPGWRFRRDQLTFVPVLPELRVITQCICYKKGRVPQIPGQGQLLVCELLRDVMILI